MTPTLPSAGLPEAVLATDVSVHKDGVSLLPRLSFRLSAGRALALRGANGSGKTTALRLVAGQLRSSTGSIQVFGRTPHERHREFRSHVAALMGNPPFARDLTVTEHLRLVAVSWGKTTAQARSIAGEMLGELGIASLAERFPTELSSGQRQLFSLALAVARPAQLLLLDEPEQRLDDERREHLAAMLRRRISDGLAVLMATHSDALCESIRAEVLTIRPNTDTETENLLG